MGIAVKTFHYTKNILYAKLTNLKNRIFESEKFHFTSLFNFQVYCC